MPEALDLPDVQGIRSEAAKTALNAACVSVKYTQKDRVDDKGPC